MVDKNRAVVCYFLAISAIMYPKRRKPNVKCTARSDILLTYSMEHSPSREANRFSASQEIPAFYGTRRFITATGP
jgi:hypothetical protein